MLQSILKKTLVAWWAGVFLILALADQLIKYFIPEDKFFFNHQFAFSLPVPGYLMYIIYFFILLLIFLYLRKNYLNFSRFEKIAWALILAGGVSNIAERLVLGYVRDYVYISFNKWIGVYNLADFYIIIGIIIVFLANHYKLQPKS